ncbi:juvenile hormone acid O-methyltransferase-like [Branchiostoma lanceolatum]|uniref:juvenile hormone acid O-methyltransferase-like n=1 Tax=Branchiostoma lanceolatum TaxID=7740 RepID=UPI00345394E9
MDTTKPKNYSQNRSFQHCAGLEALQQYMQWEEGETVLDAGCGTGETCKYISQQPGVASVVGFDVSSDFISYCNQRNSFPNILYHVADVTDVSTFEPEWQGAFNKVVSFFVLHWVQDKVTALKALHSCLKPRGEILMIFGSDKSNIVQTNSKMTAHPKWKIYLKDSVPNFPWPSSDRTNHRSRLLEECGFEVLSCSLVEHRQLVESEEKLMETLRAVYPLMHCIPKDEHEEFLDDMKKMAREAYLISGDDEITEASTVVLARKL